MLLTDIRHYPSLELPAQIQVFEPYQIGISFHFLDNRLHIGFDDPSHATGTPEFIDAEFRRVRDEIKNAFARFYLTEIKKQELPKCTCGGSCK